jgi:hypothetical protein
LLHGKSLTRMAAMKTGGGGNMMGDMMGNMMGTGGGGGSVLAPK